MLLVASSILTFGNFVKPKARRVDFMKAKSKLLTVVTTVFFLTSFCGCSNKEDESPEGQALDSESSGQLSTATAQGQTDSRQAEVQFKESNEHEAATLPDALQLAKDNNMTQACEVLVDIKWNENASLPIALHPELSETGFLAMWRNEREEVHSEMMGQVKEIKALCRHALDTVAQLKAEGDLTSAKNLCLAVDQLGERLLLCGDGNPVGLVRLLGEAIKKKCGPISVELGME
jgi:hypothetical protein